jgi:hypothetical protein
MPQLGPTYHHGGSGSIPGQVRWDVVDEVQVGQFSASTSVSPDNSHSIKIIQTHLSSRSDTIDQRPTYEVITSQEIYFR